MASLSQDKRNGTFTLKVMVNGTRRTVRLGKVTRKTAEAVRLRVEHLAGALHSGQPLDGETAAWVGALSDDLAGKLAKAGLVAARRTSTLGGFLAEYTRKRETDGHTKPATLVTIARVVTDLKAVLGEKAPLRTIGAAEAERFLQHYQDERKAGATIYRRLKMAKMLFAHAVKLKLTPANPFADVKGKNANPAERQHYVTAADTLELIEHANPTWRTIIALARFAGLRCPSEVLSLKWADVDLAAGRMTVPSPKTEHLEGKAYRVCPVFATLRPHLEDAFELAEPGAVFVVGGPQGELYRANSQKKGGWQNTSLSTAFRQVIKRAGLGAWPRLFHNLRASCETDLMQRHPIHVVTAWIGNTPKIALGHYLQTLEGDFLKAVRGEGGPESGPQAGQIAGRNGAEPRGAGRKESAETPDISGDFSTPFPPVPLGSYCTSGQGGT